MNPYSLYIHIPFCISKCAYCDFLSFPSDEITKQKYVESLCYEIQAYSAFMKAPINTIFLGGGTPTSLSTNQLAQIFDCIYQYFNILPQSEITIEINPKTMDREKLEWLNKSPVNRVSIGLQSSHNHHLKRLSRIHTFEDFLDTYQSVKAAGIYNINIDLMLGLPDQTFEEWEDTLTEIVALEPTHISAYGLIIEEHTPFYRLYHNGELKLPDEDLERRMYHFTKEFLKEHQIYQYEISNYSKGDYECRHNLAYWTDVNYIGLGLGASSYIMGTRYSNTDDMEVYIKESSNIPKIRKVVQEASRERRLEETLFLGLRLNKGVNIESINRNFNNPFETIYKLPLEKYLSAGLLYIEDGFLKLSEKGFDVSNEVFSGFLLD